MKANGISARSRGVLALAEDAPSITMKAATANSFRACIFIGTSFASSWYPWSDLTDPGEALLSSYCRLRSRKMHARCQKAGRRIKDFKFLVGKRMQKFSVDTTQRMPRDHCQ